MSELKVNSETPVVFRVIDGEVNAFLLGVPASPGTVTCYAHVGQHSEAAVAYYQGGRLARDDEFQPLLSELRSIYESGDEPMKLVVRRRDTPLYRWLRYDNPRTRLPQ